MAAPIEETGTAGGACPPAGRRGCSTRFHCAPRLSKGGPSMSSKRRPLARRHDGRFRGPATPEGKAVSGLNAGKHGISASSLTECDREEIGAVCGEGAALALVRDYETNLTHRKCLLPGGVRLRGATLKRSLGVPDIPHAHSPRGEWAWHPPAGFRCGVLPSTESWGCLRGATRHGPLEEGGHGKPCPYAHRPDYETNLTHRKRLPPEVLRSETRAHVCSSKSYYCACHGLSAGGPAGGRRATIVRGPRQSHN